MITREFWGRRGDGDMQPVVASIEPPVWSERFEAWSASTAIFPIMPAIAIYGENGFQAVYLAVEHLDAVMTASRNDGWIFSDERGPVEGFL